MTEAEESKAIESKTVREYMVEFEVDFEAVSVHDTEAVKQLPDQVLIYDCFEVDDYFQHYRQKALFWKSNRCGYTSNPLDAGLYSIRDAISIAGRQYREQYMVDPATIKGLKNENQ